MADYTAPTDSSQAQAENEQFNVGEERRRIGNMLKRAANFVQTKGESHMSEMIVYERPGVGSVEVPAIIGETEYTQDDGMGFIARVIRVDYSIRQSGLVINGNRITPERSDIVRQTMDDGSVYVGRVLGEDSMPHYQESDGYGVAWRVHTKRDELS